MQLDCYAGTCSPAPVLMTPTNRFMRHVATNEVSTRRATLGLQEAQATLAGLEGCQCFAGSRTCKHRHCANIRLARDGPPPSNVLLQMYYSLADVQSAVCLPGILVNGSS